MRIMALIFSIISVFSQGNFAEDEWVFPDEGIQPYSLAEQELMLQKDQRSKPSLIVKFTNGLIVDWDKNLIVVRGQEFITGKPSDKNKKLIEKGAVYNAKIKMIKLIDEFRIDRTGRMADLFKKSYKLRTKVKNLIMNKAKVIHRYHDNDNKILEVTLAMDIFGKNSLAEALYWNLFYWENGWNKYYPGYKPTTSEAFTGLIIDARGLDLEPAILPRIVNDDEDSLYRDKYAHYSSLVHKGLVKYSNSIDAAITNNRVGPNPLTIKAVTTIKSDYYTDVIISEEDTNKLNEADKNEKFMKYLRVIIVI